MKAETAEKLPVSISSRKEEITNGFYKLVDMNIADLLQSRSRKRLHAKDFGALLFIHPRHLTNTIKLTTGRSPCDIMEEKLVDVARQMLAETERSVADIAYQLGYNDATNFSKFFKGMTGINPLQYRKSYKPVQTKN